MMFVCAVMCACPVLAQGINDKADNIVGEYLTDRGGSKSKVRITKNAQGTYDAQVFWVENPLDANGKKRKDVKNPDKALRNVDIDKVVLVKGSSSMLTTRSGLAPRSTTPPRASE